VAGRACRLLLSDQTSLVGWQLRVDDIVGHIIAQLHSTAFLAEEVPFQLLTRIYEPKVLFLAGQIDPPACKASMFSAIQHAVEDWQ
jgi:hypothetical protein